MLGVWQKIDVGGSSLTTIPRPLAVLTDVLASHGKWRPRKPALVCGDDRLDWGTFNCRMNRVANALTSIGIGRGDKVCLLMGNSIAFAEAMTGIMRAGAVIVPLSTMLTSDMYAMLINDSDARCIIADAAYAPLIDSCRGQLSQITSGGFIAYDGAPEGWRSFDEWTGEASDQFDLLPITPDDEFNIIYSSGTTGTPKGIVHSQYARLQFAIRLSANLRFDATMADLVTTPMYHNGTWMMLLPAFLVGGCAVILPSFTPRAFIEHVEKHRCTHTFMVPTQYEAILRELETKPADLSSLRSMVSTAAPLSRATKEAILKFMGPGLFEVYGLTEGIGTVLAPEQMKEKTGSVGMPAMEGDIRIVDDSGSELPRGETGEIVGFTTSLMNGYYKQPEKTAEICWRDERGRTYIRTGDVGRLDDDGFLYILDRKKDMIVSGGINVFPRDIEDILEAYPAVREAAVIGVPHEKWGESPLGIVVLEPAHTVPPEQLLAWANERLAKFQRLSGLEIRDTIPRNATGKILKRELRKPYWDAQTT
jgi:long-chain acyl-CoA synthetase